MAVWYHLSFEVLLRGLGAFAQLTLGVLGIFVVQMKGAADLGGSLGCGSGASSSGRANAALAAEKRSDSNPFSLRSSVFSMS